MLRTVDTASFKPDDQVLPLAARPDGLGWIASSWIMPELFWELWQAADCESCGLAAEEFSLALQAVGEKLNCGLQSGQIADESQMSAFFRALHLPELALAQACARGREMAWDRFLSQYRASLTQAAIAISSSATIGHELADSLYAELYGLREVEGERRSPLASYSGRGSLMGWLRSTLAQRHINHHRKTSREAPMDGVDAPAAAVAPMAAPAELVRLSEAVARSVTGLPAEDRYLLASYFLDRKTIHALGNLLRVHESTISRRLKRLTSDLRQQLLRNLQVCGLSKRAAEEALGTDPRDLEINLGKLLQTSQIGPFREQARAKADDDRRAQGPAGVLDSV